MTWPFENDTSAIVKKLADRSMKADKRRNAFIIITIAFAVSLMMVLALYNLGTDRENRLYLQGRYQGSFINSTSIVFEKLEHNNQIEAVGKEAAMGTSRIHQTCCPVLLVSIPLLYALRESLFQSLCKVLPSKCPLFHHLKISVSIFKLKFEGLISL